MTKAEVDQWLDLEAHRLVMLQCDWADCVWELDALEASAVSRFSSLNEPSQALVARQNLAVLRMSKAHELARSAELARELYDRSAALGWSDRGNESRLRACARLLGGGAE